MDIRYRLPMVSIIVPVYNGEHFLQGCIKNLLNQKYPEDCLEIIFVDNRSTDNTKKIILAEKRIKYVYSSKPGPSAARNEGLKTALGEIILLIDTDCLADPKLVIKHVIKHIYFQLTDPSITLVGGGIQGKNQNYWSLCDDFCSWFPNHPRLRGSVVSCHPTANLSFTKNIIDDVGLFDENLFSGEDYDFSIRAARKGHKIYFEPNAKVFHINRTSYTDFMKHSKNWTISEYRLREKGIIQIKYNLKIIIICRRLLTFAFLIWKILWNSLRIGRIHVLLCLPFIVLNKAYLCYYLFKADIAFKRQNKINLLKTV